MRITMDVKNFRQQLAKKIEEIRQMGEANGNDVLGETLSGSMSS